MKATLSGRDAGITLFEFAEKFNLNADEFAALENAQRDELLASTMIHGTDQLLERVSVGKLYRWLRQRAV